LERLDPRAILLTIRGKSGMLSNCINTAGGEASEKH
jgi:hypothetical protein